MSIITVVGAGMMGSAMSFPARDNGHEVRLVGIHNRENIESIRRKHTLGEALLETDLEFHIAIVAVGFTTQHGASHKISILIETEIRTIVKFFTDAVGNLTPFPEAIMRRAAERGQKICFNAVGGPVTSYELADRQQTHICFCGEDAEVLKKLKSMFSTSYYHISLTTDVAGLETAVAMKNAYALGVSLAVGINNLEYGKDGMQHYNPQAALFEQGVREAGRIISYMGGKQETAMFFAGDLYVTIFGGRTRLLGTLLGEGKTFAEAKEILSGITLESVAIATRVAEAVRQMEKMGRLKCADFPLLMHVDDLISHGAKLDIPWEQFETFIA